MRVGLKASVGLLVLASIAACSTENVSTYDLEDRESILPPSSRFTNLSEPVCRDSFSAQVASVLVKQGETADVARMMSAETFDVLLHRDTPGPFYAFSPAGVRYGFIMQSTEFGCVLRLYQRVRQLRGHLSAGVTDTLKYLDSRTVLSCSCGENEDWTNP
jgi:hypothetical protein